MGFHDISILTGSFVIMWHIMKKTDPEAAFPAVMSNCLPMMSAHAHDTDMVHGQVDMKDETGRAFRIFTAHPAGTGLKGGWPVIRLPDGNMTFPIGIREKPQALLAGTGYPLQGREEIAEQHCFDLTTQASPEKIALPPGQARPETGGAAVYLRFIPEKLRPHIEAHFPVSTDKQTPCGHLPGGLSVINTLISSQQSFKTGSAADPAIWWNSHEIMNTPATSATGTQHRPAARIRITIFGRKADRPGISKEVATKTVRLRSSPNGKTVFDILKQAENTEADFKAYEQETRGSPVRQSDNYKHTYEVKDEKAL